MGGDYFALKTKIKFGKLANFPSIEIEQAVLETTVIVS